MLERLFTLAGGAMIGTVLTSATLLSCHYMAPQSTADVTAATRHADSQPSTQRADSAAAAGTLSSQDLRDVLADMANSHNDKVKLSWWVSTPLRPVDPPFRPFFENMGKQNKELLQELQDWARQHRVDLTYHLSNDLDGRAQKIMEDRQEKLVRSDDKIKFQHDILMQMYTDYDWKSSQIQALLPSVKDPALRSYLEKSAKMYSDGSAQILSLVHRYKFQ
jgi:hypothetical protein